MKKCIFCDQNADDNTSELNNKFPYICLDCLESDDYEIQETIKHFEHCNRIVDLVKGQEK
jgi:hypothetical protein